MSRLWTFTPVLLGVTLGLHGCHEAEEAAAGCENWSYERGDCGPPWDEEPNWEECVQGDDQSPIDLREAVRDGALDPLALAWGVIDRPVVHDNGHTIQVDYRGGTLRLGEKQLDTLQFHVHVPAEHAVDGERAAMELHVVHTDAGGDPAAVVALRFEEGAENPTLAKIWGDLPTAVGEVEVDTSLDVAALLPASRAYWTYSGSLTTPPCSEGLRWIVLEQTGTVSRAQLDAVLDRVGENARALQPINNRSIGEYLP